MNDYYVTKYGLYNAFDLNNKIRPLASISLFKAESINELDEILNENLIYQPNTYQSYKYISKLYIKKNIKELFGLTLIEFINLPIDELQTLLEIANEELQSKKSINDNISKELKGLEKK